MKKANIDEFKNLLTQKGYGYFAHGTGRMGNSTSVVYSIFETGLRCSHDSLYYTSVFLNTGGEESFEPLKEAMDHWQHLDSKKIVLVRLPIPYMNMKYDQTDSFGENYFAFYKQVSNGGSELKNYVDRRFVIGCYDADTKEFEVNPYFEEVFTKETKQELSEKLKQAKELTAKRLTRMDKECGIEIPKKVTPVSQKIPESLSEVDNDVW